MTSGFPGSPINARLLTRDSCDPLEYDEAFEFWTKEWDLAIQELGLRGLSVQSSDKFVHADEVLVLRHHDEIAGLGLISHIDLSFSADHRLAYLGAMPDEAFELMRRHAVTRIMSSGYNIVTRRFRRTRAGTSLLSILLPGFVLGLFDQRPDFDLCMGMPLLSSGNHKTLDRLGMKDLHSEPFFIHDVPAKFMFSLKDQVNLGRFEKDVRTLVRQATVDNHSHDFSQTELGRRVA